MPAGTEAARSCVLRSHNHLVDERSALIKRIRDVDGGAYDDWQVRLAVPDASLLDLGHDGLAAADAVRKDGTEAELQVDGAAAHADDGHLLAVHLLLELLRHAIKEHKAARSRGALAEVGDALLRLEGGALEVAAEKRHVVGREHIAAGGGEQHRVVNVVLAVHGERHLSALLGEHDI